MRASRKSRIDKGGKRGRWRGHPYRRASTYRRTIESSQGEITQKHVQQTKRPGICFGYSMPGHWKFECPSTKATSTNNKISSVFTLILRKEQNKLNINDSIDHKENKSKSRNSDEVSETDEECLSPAGRLGIAYEKWKAITDNLYILKVIKEGYTLPLRATVPSIVLNNNKSASENLSFVQKEVEGLVRKRVVSQVTEAPEVVNSLTVAYSKKGKPRLVLIVGIVISIFTLSNINTRA